MKLKIPQYQLSEVLNMMAFKGISEADIKTMMDLRILREHYYRYNSTIFKAGEPEHLLKRWNLRMLTTGAPKVS